MVALDSQQFESFIAAKSAAAVHFDAEWNTTRAVTRRQMREAEESLSEQVNFGEVDCDANPELAKSIRLLNIPSVAYYKDGKLIAVIIGAQQNVRARLERLLRRESMERDDGLGGANAIVR